MRKGKREMMMSPQRITISLAALLLIGISPASGQSSAEDLKITVGRSIVVDYPVDISRISTSNPEIVDAVAVSTREVLLHGKALGVSTVVVWAKSGQRTFYNIAVEHNMDPIRKILRDTFPNEDIQVQAARDSLTLTGQVSSKEISDRATVLAASLAKAVVNNLKVAPMAVEKQVLLRVKFAELNRNAAKAFGVNIFSTGFLNTPGRTSTGQFSPPSIGSVGGAIGGGLTGTESTFSLTDALNVFAFRPDLNLGVTIRALQDQGVLQILAEPNLITTVGKEASFLVGGEFPIPVLQGGSNAGAVTIQFREFGIRLNFNPQLTAHNTLKMSVRPEVSTIDLANAVRLQGFVIPALSTRRMDTNIELSRGQSFVIGGLMDDRVSEQLSKVPGLADIPVLGVLFRSREEKKSKTELLVMVTPELVDPLNPEDPKPNIPMPREFLAPVDLAPKSGKSGAGAEKSKQSNAKGSKKRGDALEVAQNLNPQPPSASGSQGAEGAAGASQSVPASEAVSGTGPENTKPVVEPAAAGPGAGNGSATEQSAEGQAKVNQ
jgi:pilus assembly protein CpaC